MCPEDLASEKIEEQTEWTLEEELKTNGKLRVVDIQMMRKFCMAILKLDESTIEDRLIVAMLHSVNYDLDRAQTIAKKYFDIRSSTSEVFANRHLDQDCMTKALEVAYYFCLPRRTKEGFRIIFQGLRNKDTSIFDHPSVCKTLTLTFDSLVYEDPTCPGYVFICDMKDISLAHLWKSSIFLSKKLLSFSQEGAPIRIEQAHVVNAGTFAHTIMQWFKPFMGQRLWNMFKFYAMDDNVEISKNIPRECLPKEYGGDLPDVETLYQDHIKWLKRMEPKLEPKL